MVDKLVKLMIARLNDGSRCFSRECLMLKYSSFGLNPLS